MNKIKTVKIKNLDGSVSEESYTIAVDAKNVDMENGKELQETIGTIDIDNDGDVSNQLKDLKINKINKIDIIDNLESNNKDKVLSAKQGKILNEGKVQVFDTVADMKADTSLKEGMAVQTLGYYEANDGGQGKYIIVNDDTLVDDGGLIHVLTNGLRAKLIIENNTINVKQFGIVDNTTDVGTIINKITNDLSCKAYIPEGEYLVTTTINPSGSKTLIIDGNLNYTGNDSCIKIDTNRNYIQTKNITATNGIPVLLENSDETGTRCSNNMLYFNGTLSSTNNHAMYLHAIARGIAYNEIHFYTLAAASDKYALYIKTESTGSYAKYVNENTFYGGRCSSGLYGIYIDTGTNGTAGECNHLKFYNVVLEGITNGIYINNARWNYFNEPRIAEINSPNKTITIAGGADGNIFNINSLIYPEQIDISNLTSSSAMCNFINGEIAVAGGSRVGRDLLTYKNRLQLREKLSEFTYKNLTASVATTFDNTITDNYFLISNQDNNTYKLNQYYGSRGIDEIFLQGGYPLTIKDSYDNTVIAFTPDVVGTTEYVKITCYDLNGVDTWLAEKLAKI